MENIGTSLHQKGADAFLKFVFITGVSKFSKINLFSGLNNLLDITLHKNYATICGYTENDLEIFKEHLIDVKREELKLWYNGYNFKGESVYNPYDILLYFEHKEFRSYWFETGSPTFLIDLIKQNNYNSIHIENVELAEDDLNLFDVDNIELEFLLFQTGYLTIKEYNYSPPESTYILKYPNLEVKKSLTSIILNYLHGSSPSQLSKVKRNFLEIFKTNQLDKLKEVFYSFFASIPNNWYRKNQLANYEGYYASIFYSYFTSQGMDVKAEDVTNQGQVDMTVFYKEKIYIFEFKVIEMTEKGSALSQIKEKKYYEKYLSQDNQFPIYLIGVEFSKENRNITNYEWELLI